MGRRGAGRPPPTPAARSGRSSNSAAVHPLLHSPPRLVGKSSCGVRSIRSGATRKAMPHCSEQYGQCVGVGRSSTPLPCACRVPRCCLLVTAEAEVGSSYRLRELPRGAVRSSTDVVVTFGQMAQPLPVFSEAVDVRERATAAAEVDWAGVLGKRGQRVSFHGNGR